MNTPLENAIIDLTTLLEHNRFETRHGFNRDAQNTLKTAILICERRLQEEADVIAEAYNAAGGPSVGYKYFEALFRQGEDAAKSMHGYKYKAREFEGGEL